MKAPKHCRKWMEKTNEKNIVIGVSLFIIISTSFWGLLESASQHLETIIFILFGINFITVPIITFFIPTRYKCKTCGEVIWE